MRTNGFWVYEITTPNGMVYVGMSGKKYTCNRWIPSSYKTTALQPYIEKFGWDALKEEVVKDGLTKDEAFQLEDSLIRIYKEEGRCINNKCSGGLQCDGEWKEYYQQHKEEYKQHYETHKEEKKQYDKQYYEEHKEQMKKQMKRYRETHRDEWNEYQRKYRLRQKEHRLRTELNYDTLW